jgi:hypothetical protein
VWMFVALFGVRVAAAAPELAGTWQGKLQVDPHTALIIQFIFTKEPSGGYSAVLDSPDNGGIKSVAASAVAWDQSVLKVQVPKLSGAYVGSLKGSSIEGQWTQEGSSLPLTLSPYQKVTLSKAAIETLRGAWHGPATVPGGTLTFIARFETNEHGELGGTLGVLEQGGQELPVSDIELVDGRLSFKVPVVSGELTASYVDDSFVGSWRQGPVTAPSIPVTLKRGDVAPLVYALNLTSAQFAQISGSWQGGLSGTAPGGQKVDLPLVLRFETDKQAHYVGYVESPTQSRKGVPVTEARFADGKLDLKISFIFAEYTAEVTSKKMVGQWTQGRITNPLVLIRQ